MENQTRDHGQDNFTLPHDVVQLPSQGIFYKNKKKSIKVGYLTASDENILMGGAADLTMTLLRAKIYQLSIINGQQPNEDGSFTVLLPKSQSTIKLKPLSYGEIMDISKMAETYPQGRVVPRITWRMQKEIIEIDGSTDKAMIAKFVESMPISDSKFVRNFMNENEPRLDMTKTITAPSGEKLTVNVGFGADFFRPFFWL